MVKNNQGKIFQIGVLVGIAFFILHSIEGYLFGGLYTASDPSLWKDMTGNWWMTSLIADIIVGLVFTLVYTIFYKSVPDSGVGKGIQYGFWIWLVGAVPGLIMTFVTMAVPEELVVLWLISSLINNMILGIILGLMFKPKVN